MNVQTLATWIAINAILKDVLTKFRKEFPYRTLHYAATPVYVRKSKKHDFLEFF